MRSYLITPITLARLTVALLCVPVLSHAQAVTWDGGGDANSSGTWETSVNWNTDAAPIATDSAVLGDVSSGTRTVTISAGSPQTISDLTITQNTAGAVNRLSIEDDLTVSKTGGQPLAFTSTAGQGGIVIDIAAGKIFSAERAGYLTTANIDGTINLGANSAFNVSSSSNDATLILNGPVNAATGATLKVSGTNASLTLNGDTSLASGATLKLEYTIGGGAVLFTNNATLAMDAATLDFAWESATANNGSRNFNNTGDWTLANGSSFILSSILGRSTTGGNQVSVGNQNSGTLRVKSGSLVSSRTFFNTGTLQLGSSTGGVSDAQVHWGNQIVSNIDLTNGTDAGGVAGAGTVNVLGDTLLGHETATPGNEVWLINGPASSTGSVINVGDGSTPVAFTIQSKKVTVTNYAGNTLNLKSNSTTLLKSLLTDDAPGSTTIDNRGVIVHSGSLQIQGNKAGARSFSTTGTGVYRISGTGAVLQNNESTSGPTGANLTLVFSNAGILSGATASDKLTYVNGIPGKPQFDTLTMNQTGGSVTPGFGSDGVGVSSIGTLELVNTNLVIGSGVTMSFDIGGTVGSGLFDSLVVSGTGAALDLGGSILDVHFVNDFASVAGTYRLITADALSGTFGSLLINGGTNGGEYTVNYLSNGVEINFGMIPEPATTGLLMGGLVLFAMSARRRRRAVC